MKNSIDNGGPLDKEFTAITHKEMNTCPKCKKIVRWYHKKIRLIGPIPYHKRCADTLCVEDVA